MRLKFFLISFILSLSFWLGINVVQEKLENFFYAQISEPFQEMTFVEIPPKKPKLEIEAKSAFSLRIGKSGREKILFEKEPNLTLPIASLTKLMTALIVLEDPENYDFSKIITISKETAKNEDVPEYGNLNFGEKKSIEELLNLMLSFSSNDAAFALADEAVASSSPFANARVSEEIKVENFVERMNKKAEILDLRNTHFVNPTGLDPRNLNGWSEETKYFFNFSTVEDLAKLSQYILNEFPIIFEISSQKPIFPIKNGFAALALPQNVNIIGGKTGYTDTAGGCMLLVFESEGRYFINIVLGTDSVEIRVREMQKLIDWLGIQ